MRKSIALCAAVVFLWALPVAAKPARPGMDYRLGIVHGWRYELFEKAGIGWTRVDFTRNGIEREPGVFDWSQQDEQVDEAARHGVKMLPILDYQAAWEELENKGPATRTERASFARFAYETAKHFKGRIEAWELWNEPNIGFWKPEPNALHYALLLKAVYPAIKRADPNARVVGGSLAGTDPQFLREICRYGAAQYMDALSIHPYRYGSNPEIKFAQRIEELRDILAEHGKRDMPIWITEIGWSSSGKGRSQADQANYFIRSYLTALAAGVEVYMWFNFVDDPRGNAPVYHSGGQIVEKPAMRAIRACTTLLADAEYVGRMAWRDPEYGLIFRRGGQTVIAAWRRYGTGRPRFAATRALDQYGRPLRSDRAVLCEQVRYFILPVDAKLLADDQRRTAAARQPEKAPPRKWSYHNEKAWYSSPAVGDLNGDGKQEVVIASGEQYALLCFSAEGEELWRIEAQEPIPSSPALADIDGDGKPEILIGTNDKALWAVSGAGEILWKAPLEGRVGDGAATAANLDDDSWLEVVVGAENIVYCFDAEGKEQWRYAMTPLRGQEEAPKCVAPVAVGDVDGDGKPNVVLGATDGSVRCLDAGGQELWRVIQTSEGCRSGPVIGDLEGDGEVEILVVLDARSLYCLRGVDGQELWRFPAGDRTATSIALGDINRDGKAEIVFGDFGERLYCLSHKGELLWQWNAFGKIKTAPVLADVDGDYRVEVLIGDGQGWFSCLDDQGRLKWRFTAPHNDEILESAAVADLDGDGKLEVVFGCKHGDLECLQLGPRPRAELMPWPLRRQDAAGRAMLAR